MDNDIIDLTLPGSERLNLYAGCVDCFNGLRSGSSLESALKFGALFYRHIVVPDGFFHAYSPMSGHLMHLSSSDEGRQRNDTVLQLLRAGILVPALRRGELLHENWREGSEVGIVPGDMLTLRREHGEKALQLADEYTRYVAHWPADMAKARITDFGKALHSIFNEDSSSCHALKLKDVPEGLEFAHHVARSDFYDLGSSFLQLLEDEKSNSKFRRGQIERLICDKLGIPFANAHGSENVYDLVRRRVNWADPQRTPRDDLAYQILSVTSSVYELYQASQFNCSGGLFETHDDALVDEGFCKHLATLEDVRFGIEREPILQGSLDVSHLTVDQILRFRDASSGYMAGKSYFECYAKLASDAAQPEPGQTFRDRNSEFCHFLARRYVPDLLRKYPQTGRLGKAVGGLVVAAGAPNLVEVVSKTNTWSVFVGDYPILTYVAAGGVALGAGAYGIRSLLEYIRGKAGLRRFQKKNQYYWDRRRTGDDGGE